MPAPREDDLRALFDAGDLRAAATLALERYGPEIYGYLVAMTRGADQASDAFADFCHDLWKDLPAFRWECSLRAWCYTVARNRMLRAQVLARRAPTPLSRAPEVAALVRTTTAQWLRTEVKDRMRRLRERLDPDDQTLLILRVDRRLSWHEVAAVLDVTEPALRKRFERVTVRLRELAKEDKLVP